MDVTRVAYDVGPLAGPRTGVGTAVEALRSALATDPGVELVPYITSFRARPGDGVRRLPVPAALAHRMWRRVDWPRGKRALAGIDVCHGTNYVVPPSRCPRLVSVYDSWFLRHPDLATGDVRRAGAVLERSVTRGVAVHASSQATADALVELFPGARVEVIHLAAIPLATAPLTPPIAELAGGGYLLALGTVERRKNLPKLVEAFALVAHLLPDLRLVLAGSPGDDSPAVEAAIDAAGPMIAGRVLRTGYVDESARSWLLHHASALAYPSLDEGFGFPLLDAMQACVPIVATRVGSIPEVAGGAALLSDPGDVAQLAANVVEAVSSSEVRARLVTGGSRQVAHFSWADTARQMSALYRRLADEHAS